MTAWATGALAGAAVLVLSLPPGSQSRLHALPALRRPGEQPPDATRSGSSRVRRVRARGPAGRGAESGAAAAPTRPPDPHDRGDGPGGSRSAPPERRHHAGWLADTGSGRQVAAAVVLAVVVSGLLGGPALAVLVPALLVAGRGLLVARARAQARDGERRGGIEACAALAAELRAGSTPADALEVAAGLATGQAGESLRAATAAARLGGDVPGALARDADSSAIPEALRGLAACWQVCSRAGSGLAAAVERLADGLRARRQQEEAVAAALAGPRASAALLAGLPAVGVALAAGLGARPLHVLLHTPVGLGCLALGTGLDVLGLWWTRRLVDRAARAVQ